MAHSSAKRRVRFRVESLEGRALLSAGGSEAARGVLGPGTVHADASKAAPMTATLTLSPGSNPDGNGIVTTARVMLVGQTVPGAKVRLLKGHAQDALVTRADAEGNFRMPVVVGVGNNTVKVLATDAAGQQATASMTVSRGDVVVAWNETALDVIRAADENVGMASRNFAMVQGAVYDAINDVIPTHAPYRYATRAPVGTSAEAAASSAAYQVLLALYPKQEATLNAALAETLASSPGGRPQALGIAFGQKVAADYLAWRADDGSSAAPAYKVSDAPGQWRPTPPDYRNAWGPAWGQVTPFAMPDAAAFDPPPPPALNSPAYAAALNQVESLGAVNSTTRTPDETQAGYFWAYDTAGTGPPVINYNEILDEISLQKHNSLTGDARLFALADVAMADSGIVAWQAKYDDDLWRPVTAIQLADTDGNPATIADPTWMPLGAPGHGILPNYTPPFPSYISGHAAFGGALFTVLTHFYGTDDVHFSLTSDELPGVVRSYNSFSAASEENAMSRIYLGIHFSFDATAGTTVGNNIGNYVYQHEMR